MSVIALINALADQHRISALPTLRFYINGIRLVHRGYSASSDRLIVEQSVEMIVARVHARRRRAFCLLVRQLSRQEPASPDFRLFVIHA